MNAKIPLFFLITLLLTNPLYAETTCLDWFLQSGLAPKTNDCALKCAVTPVDMSTFSCTSDCQELCNKSFQEKILDYVSRLTEGDKLIITKMPYEAFRAFQAKQKVDKLTLKIFKTPGRQDESDAFRHFVWSALLTQDLGEQKAKAILNAHEEDSTQSKQEKAMDIFNNSQGQGFTTSTKKNNKNDLSLKDIEKEALLRLKSKKLKVLKSRFDKIPGGYYSK